MPNSPTRITQELELANMNHAKRWLQNLPTRMDHVTEQTRTLQNSWRTSALWQPARARLTEAKNRDENEN